MAKTSEEEKIKALAHPCRRGIMGVIVGRSNQGPVSPSEIAGELGKPLPNVASQVRVLVACEVIQLEETRPTACSLQHFYSPHPHFMALPWAPMILALLSLPRVSFPELDA